MPWITLTPEHVTSALAAAEATSLRTLQLTPGQSDPLPEVIERTVSRVQGYVATRYKVGQPGTIPDQLLDSTIAIARWTLIGRLPAKLLATEIRRQQHDVALAELKDVSTGKFKLTLADDPADEQPGGQSTGAWGSSKKI